MSSAVFKYSLSSKNVLTPDEAELYELTQLAGIQTDPSLFKILLDLLKLNVAPAAILHMMKSMSGQLRRKKPTQAKHHPDSSNVTSTQKVRQPTRTRDVRR